MVSVAEYHLATVLGATTWHRVDGTAGLVPATELTPAVD